MWDNAKYNNRVSPVNSSVGIGQFGENKVGNNKLTTTVNVGTEGSDVRRRRKKSVDCGTEEYAKYVEKRVFNKRHAWTPYLWQRKRDIRKLAGLNPTKGWKGWKFRQKMRWNSFKITIREWSSRLEIWRDSLKRIEGYQGTGVVSYFVFLRFLFFLNIFVFLVMFIAVVFFQAAFSTTPYTKETTGHDDPYASSEVILAENCSARYKTNSTSGFQLVLDFVQGTGWMGDTAFFYGYYGNTEVDLPGGSYNMPLAYFMATLTVLVVSLIVMMHYMFTKYMDTLMIAQTDHNNAKTFFNVLATWDHRVNGEQPILMQQKGFYYLFLAELEEYRHDLRKKNASTCSRVLLWTVRILVNCFIIVLLGVSAAAIYYAQTFSVKFTTDEKDDHHMIVVLFVQFLPSLVIVAMNALFPLLFTAIVKLERYRPSVVIKITLLRIVFVRLAALIMITLTIYLEITCSPSDDCSIGTGDCPKIQCWEVYFGQQMYKLAVTEFFADVAVTLAYELPRKLLTTKLDYDLLKKIGPAEFDIPINVLDLVYAQSLCWLGFYFAPLLPVVCLIRLIALFFLRKLSALYNTIPPEKPYHAAKSNAFFMLTLMVAFFLTCIPLGFVLVELEPSRMCGPFRIYDHPSEIVSIQISIGADWFQSIWTIVTSSAFIAVIILILSMTLYYCSALKSVNGKTISALRQQLIQDEKDKQFLIVQLSKYTNEYNQTTETAPIKQKPISPTTDQVSKQQGDKQTDEQSLAQVREKNISPRGVVVQAYDDW